MNEELKRYEKYWTTLAQDCWLVLDEIQTEPLPEHCIIARKSTGALLIMEDDELALEVKKRMHAAGVPIVSGDTYTKHFEQFKERWAAEEVEMERRLMEREARRKSSAP